MWVLKLLGQVSSALIQNRSLSAQSAFLFQVRRLSAVTATASAAVATPTRRGPSARTPATRQPAKPIEGRYRNRSAMILPMINNRLEVGRSARKKKAPKKHARGSLRYSHATSASMPVTPARAATPTPQVGG